MNNSLKLSLNQKVSLTPGLRKAIRLLGLSTDLLNKEIKQIVEKNPILEAIDQYQTALTAEYATDRHFFAAARTKQSTGEFRDFYTADVDLREHLREQLALLHLPAVDQAIALVIIDGIDDNGFLTESWQDIQTSLKPLYSKQQLSIARFERVLSLVQRLEPLAVGARNLQECLLIQLDALGSDIPFLREAKQVVQYAADFLADKHYSGICQRLHLSSAHLQGVIALLRRLKSQPAPEQQANHTQYIIPDVVIKKQSDHWHVMLNPIVLPQLEMNHDYTDFLEVKLDKTERTFLQRALIEAKWLINSIQKRQQTILKIACYIVDYQQDFLQKGEEAAIRPLTLQRIARQLNMHESTISRATTEKYIHTPWGIFELKYFVAKGLSTKKGCCHAAIAIQAKIKQLVELESPTCPWSDKQLVSLLVEQGMSIARRTVSKYRCALGIPAVHVRKRTRQVS